MKWQWRSCLFVFLLPFWVHSTLYVSLFSWVGIHQSQKKITKFGPDAQQMNWNIWVIEHSNIFNSFDCEESESRGLLFATKAVLLLLILTMQLWKRQGTELVKTQNFWFVENSYFKFIFDPKQSSDFTRNMYFPEISQLKCSITIRLTFFISRFISLTIFISANIFLFAISYILLEQNYFPPRIC